MALARAARRLCIGALICALPGMICLAGDPPAAGSSESESGSVFSKLTLDEALAKVKGSDKAVVVDFTATWCGPCKLMDRTSWRDNKVKNWIKDNAIAVQIDVDASKEVAQAQRVMAMPTILVFRKGDIVERHVGMLPADDLLAMLEGTKNSGGARGGAKIEKSVNAMSMQERMRAARTLSENGKFEDATKEYVWLWTNMVRKEPAMVGVRGSFLANDIERLAQVYKPALVAFTSERDKVEKRLKTPDRTFDDLSDWIVLNGVIGEPDATLVWFDRIENDSDSGPTLRRFSFRLTPLLEERGRWADLGKLESDPVGKLRSSHAMWARMPPMRGADAEFRKQMEAMNAAQFRKEAASMYVGQLAAGKSDQAAKVLDLAVKLDPSADMRMALVAKALEAHQVRRTMLDQLDLAEKAGADTKDLRAKVAQALDQSAG